MNYRSISDMNATLVANLNRLPPDLDLVVGVPRSGLLPANLLAMTLNIQLSDLDSYVQGRVYTPGTTKAAGMRDAGSGRRKVLVIDDSINGGNAMTTARERVQAAATGDEVIFAAVYGSLPRHPEADIVFETVPWPRLFQWNFAHHKFLAQSCVEIDGVLCHGPTDEEQGDEAAYLRFLAEARPLYSFTRPIGTLLTNRSERYRGPTEAWLDRHGLRYDKLVMLDLPDEAERQRAADDGSFKADHYRTSEAIVFIEGEDRQAMAIAERSGKPVLSLETNTLMQPSTAAALLQRVSVGTPPGASRLLKRTALAVLGANNYTALKKRLLS